MLTLVAQRFVLIASKSPLRAPLMSIFTIPKVLCSHNITYKVRFASLLYETFRKQNWSFEVGEHIHVDGPLKPNPCSMTSFELSEWSLKRGIHL